MKIKKRKRLKYHLNLKIKKKNYKKNFFIFQYIQKKKIFFLFFNFIRF
jgi:hypothetical protein